MTQGVAPEAPSELANLALNLRYLCEQSGAVSTICRTIGINRQQFNKYLAGTHAPAPINLKRIARHFGLSQEILRSEHEYLRTLVEGDFFRAWETLRRQSKSLAFLQALLSTPSATSSSLPGVYDRFQYSSIYPGQILRSSFCIYRNEEYLNHYYVERFPESSNPSKTEFVFHYYGFVVPLEDRVFTVDFECAQGNELTFGIYSSVKRSSKRLMLGISSGIAANMLKQPYATKVALCFKRQGMLTKEDLRPLTLLESTDCLIPKEVKDYLGDGSDMLKPS